MLKKVRKVIRTGNRTTMISIGSTLPKTWQYYYIKEVQQSSEDEITITLKRVQVNGENNE